MANRDLLLLGTSAGGVEALRHLARALPHDLPASVLVVIHLSSHFKSSLDAILSGSGPLTATFAHDGEEIRHGHIYIAPAEHHLLLDKNGRTLRLGNGPRENNACPAIDPLFRSVALGNGHRAVGIVLTGTLGDGASGLQALQHGGGIAVVQDPEDAAFSEMPSAALHRCRPDYVSRLADIPALIEDLVLQVPGSPAKPSGQLRYEELERPGRRLRARG